MRGQKKGVLKQRKKFLLPKGMLKNINTRARKASLSKNAYLICSLNYYFERLERENIFFMKD